MRSSDWRDAAMFGCGVAFAAADYIVLCHSESAPLLIVAVVLMLGLCHIIPKIKEHFDGNE